MPAAASRTMIAALECDLETVFASLPAVPAATANEYLGMAFDVEVTAAREALERNWIRESLYDIKPQPGSMAGSALAFKLFLTDENVVTATANFILAILMGEILGGLDTNVDGEVAVTGNVGAVNNGVEVASADVPNIAVGQMLVFEDVTDGTKSVRFVKEVNADEDTAGGAVAPPGTTTAIFVTQNFLTEAGAAILPAAADKVTFGHTAYKAGFVPSGSSRVFRATYEDTNEQFDLWGCRQRKLGLSVQDGRLALAFDWAATKWARNDGASMPGRSWQFGDEIRALFGECLVAGSQVDVANDFGFEFDAGLVDLPTMAGQGRYEYEATLQRATMGLRPLFGNTIFDYFSNETEFELQISGEAGASAGTQHYGVHMGLSHLVEQPNHEDQDGLSTLPIQCRAGRYTGDTAPLGNLGDTDVRIGLITTA